MESRILRLLLIPLTVGTGVTGIGGCGSDGDDNIAPAITSIVEGFTSNKISGQGEDEVDVDLIRPVASPTGQILTTLKQITIPPGEIVASTRTNADGYYRFTDVPTNETYFITYRKSGFIDEAYFEVTVEPELPATVEPVPLLETRFDTNAGIISGTVTDAARPDSPQLGGVLVQVRAGINNRSGTVLSEDTTSDNGSYSLTSLDAGNYTLEATRSGYQTAYFDALVLDADSDPSTSNETVVGTVALVPDDLLGVTFPFSGTVFAAYGDEVPPTGPFPLSGAAVRIREGINNTVGTFTPESFTTTTGFYSFDNVSAGQYTLEGALSGFNFGYIDIPLGASLTNQNVTLMPLVSDLSQQITIVLTWATTTNLDGRLTDVVPEPVQVPSLNDDVDGYGPETTLLEVVISSKRYDYYVNDFTGPPLAASGAQVRVYRGNNLTFTFDLPLNDEDAAFAKNWHVFSLENDRFIPVNDLVVGPEVRVSDVSAFEGSSNENRPLDFPVSLSSVSNSDIVLDMVTKDGTATVADNDYRASDFLYSTNGGDTWIEASGTNGTVVTIPADRSSILVRVFSIGDTDLELNETFTLGVSRVIFGIVNDISDTGTGTIIQDELI